VEFGGRVALCLGAGSSKTQPGDAMKALILSKLAMVAVAALVLAVRTMAQESSCQLLPQSYHYRHLYLPSISAIST
jgi:hypothetical protein